MGFHRIVPDLETKLICFDCDSTLSAIEGVDELARLRGPECFAQIEQMTRDAMDGRIALDEVFGRRLQLIRPTRAEAALVAQQYIEHVEPTAQRTIVALKLAGWTPVIVSAGHIQVIEPLAEFLGIGRIEAVRLEFDEAGNYAGYEQTHPATRRGGKPVIVRALQAELRPVRTVLVGDGVSDLETRDGVDLFVGFGRYVRRERVEAEAHHFISALSGLKPLLLK